MCSRRVVHLTSVHPRYDTRIFVKQCRSLARHGYEVSLVVADGKGDESRDGVTIFDVGRPGGRMERMFRTTGRVFHKGLDLQADAYHLHDPELLPVGLRLKSLGKTVIFDSHEDVPSQIRSKPYLGPVSLRVLSAAAGFFMHHACRRLDGIVAATPTIRDKFLPINRRTVDVNNYPVPDELFAGMYWADKQLEVCYVGDITAGRGIREIVRACEFVETPVRLTIGGAFSETSLETEVRSYSGWNKVNMLGFLSRDRVREVLGRSMAGLVTLHPQDNYLDALPVKMFEYMAAGIPVIASDFPLWRKIVEGNGCGICVDPRNPREIARAIDYLVTHPDEACAMSANGRQAVLKHYNWGSEEEKLQRFYSSLT
jgi:glycosyltransferase involved in cell wall biosynthesis